MKKSTTINIDLKALYKKHACEISDFFSDKKRSSLSKRDFINCDMASINPHIKQVDIQALHKCLCQLAKQLARNESVLRPNYKTDLHCCIADFIDFLKTFNPENRPHEEYILEKRMNLISEIFEKVDECTGGALKKVDFHSFIISNNVDIELTISSPLSDLIKTWNNLLKIIEGQIMLLSDKNTEDSDNDLSFYFARYHLTKVDNLIRRVTKIKKSIDESDQENLVTSEQLRQDLRVLLELIVNESKEAFLMLNDGALNRVNQVATYLLRINNRSFDFKRLNLLLVEVIPSCAFSACEFIDTEKGRLNNLVNVATKKKWPITSEFLNKVQNPLDSKSVLDIQAQITNDDKATENDEEDDYSEIDMSIKNQILNALVNSSKNHHIGGTTAKVFSMFTDSPYFNHLEREVFSRLDNTTFTLANNKIFSDLKDNMVERISKRIIKQSAKKGNSQESFDALCSVINKDFQKLVKSTIDTKPGLNTPNNQALHILKEILLVLFAALCLFLPMISETYRDFTFKTPPAFQLTQVTRELDEFAVRS